MIPKDAKAKINIGNSAFGALVCVPWWHLSEPFEILHYPKQERLC